MSNPDEFDDLRNALVAASPGPWASVPVNHTVEDDYRAPVCYGIEVRDAEFIALARNRLPALLDALAAVTAERDALRAELGGIGLNHPDIVQGRRILALLKETDHVK